MDTITLHVYFTFVNFASAYSIANKIITIIGLWEWLIVGVVIANNLTVESNLGELSPQQYGGFCSLMRAKVSTLLEITESFWLGSCEVGTITTRAENESTKRRT